MTMIPDDLADRIAPRVSATLAAATPPEDASSRFTIPASMQAAVGSALLAGDTHYTSRPGTPALRKAVAGLLISLGQPAYDPASSIVICAGEREALFVTLLALKVGPGRVTGASTVLLRHRALLALLGLEPVPAATADGELALVLRDAWARDDEAAALAAIASRQPSVLDVVTNGDVGAAGPRSATPFDPARTILVGGLDTLPGLAAFGCGYVAWANDRMGRVRGAKQAFSICTAAPSQQAALTALTRVGVAS